MVYFYSRGRFVIFFFIKAERDLAFSNQTSLLALLVGPTSNANSEVGIGAPVCHYRIIFGVWSIIHWVTFKNKITV